MQEKTIQLRSGQALLLRQVHPEDARAMLNYLERTSAETHFMVRLPEEVTFSLEEEQALLADCLSSDRRIMLAAFAGDCIVGNVAIAPVGERYKVRHRANLGIAIVQEYCNCGLGTILMQEGIAFAREAGYEQAELGVFADNAPAIHLYRKCGFRDTGRIPRAFHLPDGSCIDEIQMVKFLAPPDITCSVNE